MARYIVPSMKATLRRAALAAAAALVALAVPATASASAYVPPLSLVRVGPATETAQTGHGFPHRLQVKVERAGRPVAGIQLTFILPAPAHFTGVPAAHEHAVVETSDKAGVATSPPAVAGEWAMKQWGWARVTYSQVVWTLVSTEPAPVTLTGGWTAVVLEGHVYPQPLVVHVTRAGKPVGGVPVTFDMPYGGRFVAALPSEAHTVTVMSDVAGVATSPAVRAGDHLGCAEAWATAPGSTDQPVWRLGGTAPGIVGNAC